MLRERDEIPYGLQVAVGRDREELHDYVRDSRRLNIHRPRTKYLDVAKANLTYKKHRRHRKSQMRKMIRRLLSLLSKILKEIRQLQRSNEQAEKLLTVREKNDLCIITKMYHQQKKHFDSNNSKESIPERIVSLSKPYVRPIVRGKKVKSVEVRSESKQHIG